MPITLGDIKPGEITATTKTTCQRDHANRPYEFEILACASIKTTVIRAKALAGLTGTRGVTTTRKGAIEFKPDGMASTLVIELTDIT